MPKIPDILWRESGRPAMSWVVRGWVAVVLIATGWILATFVAPVGVYGWVISGLGVAAFFAIPPLVDALVLERFAARVDAVERTRAHKLLDELRNHNTIKMLAPHGWVRIQEAKLHLAVDEHRAAAKAFAEAERVSKHSDKAALLSAQAHAHALGGDRKEARELLAKLAKLDRLSDLDHFNFGIVLLSEAGHNKEALAHLEQASESFGEHPRLLAALVLARQRCDQIERATALLEQAEAAVETSGDLLAQDLLKRAKKALRPLLKTKTKRERKAGAAEEPARVARPVSAPVSAPSPAAAGKLAAKSEKPKGKKGRKQARRDARKQAKAADRRDEPVVEDSVEDVAIETPVVGETSVVGEKPVDEAKPVVEDKPVEEAKPVEDAKPVDEAKPAVEDKPVVEAKPVEDAKPVDEDKPAVEAKPTAAEKPLDEEKPLFTFGTSASPKPASKDEDDFDLASLARSALSSGVRPKLDDSEPRSSTSGIRPLEPVSPSTFRSALFSSSEPEEAAKPSLFGGLPKFDDLPKFTPPPMPPRGSLLPPKPTELKQAEPKPAEPKPAEPKLAPVAATPTAPKPAAPISPPSPLAAPKPAVAAPSLPLAPSLPTVPNVPNVSAPNLAAPNPSAPAIAPALDDGWGDLGDLAPPVVPPANPDNSDPKP